MNNINKNVNTVNGVRAIELYYRAIKEISGNSTEFYQTEMRLNAPLLGVLMPDRYLPVTDISEQSIKLFKLAFVQLVQAITKFTERGVSFKWVSLYMPVAALKNADSIRIISEICRKFNVSTDKVCFELPVTLLNESDACASENINELRKLGFSFLLSEFGEGISFMMKLAEYRLDYILLDSSITRCLGKNERSDGCAKSIIGFINDLNAEPIATDVTKNFQIDKLAEFDCLYYTGGVSENYMLEKYVRRKSE